MAEKLSFKDDQRWKTFKRSGQGSPLRLQAFNRARKNLNNAKAYGKDANPVDLKIVKQFKPRTKEQMKEQRRTVLMAAAMFTPVGKIIGLGVKGAKLGLKAAGLASKLPAGVKAVKGGFKIKGSDKIYTTAARAASGLKALTARTLPKGITKVKDGFKITGSAKVYKTVANAKKALVPSQRRNIETAAKKIVPTAKLTPQNVGQTARVVAGAGSKAATPALPVGVKAAKGGWTAIGGTGRVFKSKAAAAREANKIRQRAAGAAPVPPGQGPKAFAGRSRGRGGRSTSRSATPVPPGQGPQAFAGRSRGIGGTVPMSRSMAAKTGLVTLGGALTADQLSKALRERKGLTDKELAATVDKKGAFGPKTIKPSTTVKKAAKKYPTARMKPRGPSSAVPSAMMFDAAENKRKQQKMDAAGPDDRTSKPSVTVKRERTADMPRGERSQRSIRAEQESAGGRSGKSRTDRPYMTLSDYFSNLEGRKRTVQTPFGNVEIDSTSEAFDYDTDGHKHGGKVGKGKKKAKSRKRTTKGRKRAALRGHRKELRGG
jgi:hypothetical protein